MTPEKQGARLKITGIDCYVLLDPECDPEACSSAQDNLVVEVHTDEGISGIGETDTNPWIARECIRAIGTHNMGRGLEELLLNADPMQPESLWQSLYVQTKMTGRRGSLICALGALDMAIWDIKGKALGVPIHTLLGGQVVDRVTPYASLLPTGRTVAEYRTSLVAKLKQAQEMGFRAAKLEVCLSGPYAHNALRDRHDVVVEIVAECREAVGPDFVLMVDVAYAWPDAKAALRLLQLLEPFDLFFVETPIDIDDLAGYAFLHDHSPVRIAAGEWQNTHFEFLDLADRGQVDVLQPDIGRVGGFTEAKKVVQIAADRGRLVVPHCWKSGIGIGASIQLCATSEHCPYLEFLPRELSESTLRKELVLNELEITEGTIEVPSAPGLGVEINRDALARYRVA